IVLAVNYGGRDEIVRAVNRITADPAAGSHTITEADISSAFDIPDLPDVDLLIRTGGEKRLSNFLMWKSAYAELVFSDTLWPDYGKEEFYRDITAYQRRTRKFGAVLDDTPEGGRT
ncbi:MAG: undecaprenyl diphosphate synthase family protein, partial [Treponema sp.]|nr:undecaprenyl diphosphate synthase family protein [Treponema sp.]